MKSRDEIYQRLQLIDARHDELQRQIMQILDDNTMSQDNLLRDLQTKRDIIFGQYKAIIWVLSLKNYDDTL
jgi:hypothetical protein